MERFFDFVIGKCPKCSNQIEAEVKGDCAFEKYDLEKPVCISDAQKLAGNVVACDECGAKFEITGDIPSHKIHLYFKEL